MFYFKVLATHDVVRFVQIKISRAARRRGCLQSEQSPFHRTIPAVELQSVPAAPALSKSQGTAQQHLARKKLDEHEQVFIYMYYPQLPSIDVGSVFFSGSGQITHVIDGVGATVNSSNAATLSPVVTYP